MLAQISIEQFALIDALRLEPEPGLNVLTGETGAGKSIIIDAMEAVLGGRTSADVVRAGQERAVVEAVFDLAGRPDRQAALQAEGIEIDEDSLLVVRREISRSRGSAVRLNGRAATIGTVRRAMAGLMDLHGQHEHQSLLQPERHRELLDELGGEAVKGLAAQLQQVHAELTAVRRELKLLGGDARERARQEDLLRFQVAELQAARLHPGEEEELEAERRVLSGAARLRQVAEEAYHSLYEGGHGRPAVHDVLSRLLGDLGDAAHLDPSLTPVLELLNSAAAEISEAGHFLAAYRRRVEDNPARLSEVEARLDLIYTLQRKYGQSIAEMLAYLKQAGADLERLQHQETLAAELAAKEEAMGQRAMALAAQLSEARRRAAAHLAERLMREVADLGLGRTRFGVNVEPAVAPDGPALWRAIAAHGWDRVEFLFSPNPGEPLLPLHRIVSGGEMSRLMLALRVVLARLDNVPVLIFDEVDQGVSGRAAQAVAEKLAVIARDRQVICVTHLPQVAAMADCHFQIVKDEVAGRTLTRVTPLNEQERAMEIARLIGGAELTPLTVDNAREMLRSARGLKLQLRSAS